MSLEAYIRYDSTGRLVPGGPIVVADKPAVGNWQPVTEGTNVTLSGKLRAFIKVDRYNKPIASTLFFGKKQPATGKWIEVNATFAGSTIPTTSTTTTSIPGTSTTTSTSTTTQPSGYSYNILWVPPGESFFSAGGCSIPFSVVYSNSPSLTSGTRLYRNSNLTNELEDGGQVFKQVAPFGDPNNFSGGTYIQGIGIYAFNSYTTC